MMYSEFIEISGKTEEYISYTEYSTFIEPIYIDSKCKTKYEFIYCLDEAFKKLVYPAVEKAMKKLSLEDKLLIINDDSEAYFIKESIEKVDFEARKLAYEYLKFYTNL